MAIAVPCVGTDAGDANVGDGYRIVVPKEESSTIVDVLARLLA